jgi:hypothetical protein
MPIPTTTLILPALRPRVASAERGADPVEDRPRRAGEASTACQRPSFSASAAMVTVTRVTFSPIGSTRTVTRSAIRSIPFSAGTRRTLRARGLDEAVRGALDP